MPKEATLRLASAALSIRLPVLQVRRWMRRNEECHGGCIMSVTTSMDGWTDGQVSSTVDGMDT